MSVEDQHLTSKGMENIDPRFEVQVLSNGVVRASAPQLSFNDEPSFFAATLNNNTR